MVSTAGDFFYVPNTPTCPSAHGFTKNTFPAPDANTAVNYTIQTAAWRGGVSGGDQTLPEYSTATMTGASFVWSSAVAAGAAATSATFTIGALAAGANGFATFNLTSYSPSTCSGSVPGDKFSDGTDGVTPYYLIADASGNYVRPPVVSLHTYRRLQFSRHLLARRVL